MWSRPVTFVNGLVIGDDGETFDSLRVSGRVIDGVGVRPRRQDAVVDLDGAIVSPGLINAHDHLELNSYSRLKWRSQYGNVREWIADFQPRFNTDPALAARGNDTLEDRLWVGGLKNLLSGVTTVCHHNPLHRPLKRRFPVRVVRRFGLSHSLQIDGARVAASYRRTPSSWPWIIHAAEGIDDEARAEVKTLASLKCLGRNTVLVHGVALTEVDVREVVDAAAALVWCPSSNDFLFGRTATVREFAAAHRLALGTDSRLSGEGDLLDELRVAARTRQLSAEALLRTVTKDAAVVLRVEAGRFAPGQAADLVVLRRVATDPFESFAGASRADVRLTMIGGEPLVGTADMSGVFEARLQRYVAGAVDGKSRLFARWIARRIVAMAIREPGVEVFQ